METDDPCRILILETSWRAAHFLQGVFWGRNKFPYVRSSHPRKDRWKRSGTVQPWTGRKSDGALSSRKECTALDPSVSIHNRATPHQHDIKDKSNKASKKIKTGIEYISPFLTAQFRRQTVPFGNRYCGRRYPVRASLVGEKPKRKKTSANIRQQLFP